MGYYDEDGGYHSFREGLHREADRVRYSYDHGSAGSSDTGSSSGTDEDEVYEFVPSRSSAIPSKENVPSVHSLPPALSSVNRDSPNVSRVMHVYKSQYAGTASLDGLHTSKLTLLHGPAPPEHVLFTWVHVQQPVMHFADFADEINHLSNLKDSQRHGIRHVLEEVKKRKIKPVKTGRESYSRMELGAICHVLPAEDPTEERYQPYNPQLRIVHWIAIPSFLLAKYTTLTGQPGTFPMQTLMQADYSRSPKAKDMQQAACQTWGMPREQCFHVGQVWFVVVDNSLIISCSTLPEEALRDDLISIITRPPTVPPNERPPPRPRERGRLVSIPGLDQTTDEAPSGSATPGTIFQDLPQNFQVFAEYNADSKGSEFATPQVNLSEVDEFLRQGTSSKDQNAYKMCLEARRSDVRSYLIQLGVDEMSSKDGFEDDVAAAKERIDIFNAVDIVLGFFLPAQFSGPTVKKFWGALKVLIDRPWPSEREQVMWNQQQRTADSNVADVRTSFRHLSRKIQLFQNIMSHAQEADKVNIQIPVELMRAWIYLVLAVVHGSLDSKTCRSYLDKTTALVQAGTTAILRSLSRSSLLQRSAVLPIELSSLMNLNLLKGITGGYPDISDTYSEYLKALTTEIETQRSVQSQKRKIQQLLAEIRVIMKVLSQQSVVAMDLARSASKWRNRNRAPRDDDVNIGPPAHAETRTSAYATKTQHIGGQNARSHHYASRTQPPQGYNSRAYPHASRTHPVEGRTFHQPNNEYVWDSDYWPARGEISRLSPTDEGGFWGLLAEECVRLVEQRQREFGEFSSQAVELQQAYLHKAETRRDYQDKALYAFTIVTVIFLPLSAVASIFGMNTTDIRDMNHSQWLYWATAIPVTVCVISIGLWWTADSDRPALWFLRPLKDSSVQDVRDDVYRPVENM